MKNNWEYKRIQDLAEKVGMGPFGSSIKVETFVPEGIPIVSGQHLHGNRLDEEAGFNYISEKHADRLLNANVYPGDVIFTHAGNIGNVAYIPENSKYRRYVASQRQFFLRCDKKKLLPEFITYYFKTHEGQYKLKANSSSVGVPSIAQPVSYLKQLTVLVPPLPEQRAIADVLSALDDKIELNSHMNATLEQLAQAIYKHMFIDNPDRENWEEKTLDSVCGFEYGKALKETSRVFGKIPVYGSNGLIGYHNEFLVKGPGIVVGRKGNPGIITFVHTDFFPIDTTFYVVPKNILSFFWLFFTLSDLNLPNLGADSAVPGLNRNIAYMSLVTIPPTKLFFEFENLIAPLFEKIHLNNKESKTLAELRDTLLPKLMSGQVRVKT